MEEKLVYSQELRVQLSLNTLSQEQRVHTYLHSYTIYIAVKADVALKNSIFPNLFTCLASDSVFW